MPLAFVPAQDEEVVFNELFQPTDKITPFAVAVTKKAIYVWQKKLVAVSDPWFYQRIPVSEVREVSIKRIHPYPMWFLAACLVVVGVIISYAMLAPGFRGVSTKVSGYPIAFVVVGFVIPFIIRGRWSLIISTTGKTYKWKPPFLVDSKSRQMVQSLQKGFIRACQNVGLHTTDRRV